MTFALVFLTAVACAWCWMGLIAPAILRSFGVPLAFGLWRLDRRNQNLSRSQYVWAFGVFSWGVGMFLFWTMAGYLQWRVLSDPSEYPTLRRTIGGVVIWFTTGLLFGTFTAPRRRNGQPD